MLENKGINLKSFLLIKAVYITDVPSTRSLSCLAILSWVFSGVTFIRCVRSHPSISPPHDLQSSHEYFMSIFGCDFHPVHSITSRLFDSQVPFTDPFHRSLFRSHASFASLCFSALSISFTSLYFPLYFPSERFLSNLRVCFEFIPGPFEKTSENPL